MTNQEDNLKERFVIWFLGEEKYHTKLEDMSIRGDAALKFFASEILQAKQAEKERIKGLILGLEKKYSHLEAEDEWYNQALQDIMNKLNEEN